MKTFLRLGGYISLLWLSMNVVFAGMASSSVERIALLKAPVPEYPAALMNQPVYRGFALVGCTVAADGSVVEAWTLRASHRAFADAAEKALREWRYAPAASAPGGGDRPLLRTDVVRVEFTLTGSVIAQTQLDAALAAFPDSENQLPPLYPNALAKHEVPARLEGKLPAAIPNLSGGSVVMEFFIDADGRVRLPVVLAAQANAYAEAALAAVRGWRFAGPRVEGKAAAVRVRWSFAFPKG